MSLEEYTNKLIDELNNNLPGYTSQIKMIPEGRPHKFDKTNTKNIKKSAVLILLFSEKDEIYISFIKRVSDGSKHSGQIALPGGKFEKEDKSLIKTAIRETEEEIGVNSNDVKILGKLTSLFIPVSNYDVQPVVGYINYKPEFKRNVDEVDEIYSVKLKELINAYTVCKTFEVQKEKITAPFYILNGIEIWGATAMILSEFLDITSKINKV
ncbi:MAG: CoA pyrophosphatase [Bacteroidales bacterium]|nr:CoA pyrophosphatase [Bacteroidales bacterium]